MNWPRELARQLTHPLALLLWAAALLSFIVGSITVGVAAALIIALNAAVAFIQERRAENAVEALAGYIPQKLTVVRDDTRKVIDTAELVHGLSRNQIIRSIGVAANGSGRSSIPSTSSMRVGRSRRPSAGTR